MFEMGFKFSKLVKSIVFRCLQTTKRLAAQVTAYALRNWQGKQAFVKKKMKKQEKKLEEKNLNL